MSLRDDLKIIFSSKLGCRVTRLDRKTHGDPVFHDPHLFPSKLGIRHTLLSKPEWKECPSTKDLDDSPQVVDGRTGENVSASMPRCSLMHLPNEVLIIIADYIVFNAIDSIDDPCGFYWPSDANANVDSSIPPGAFHCLRSTISEPHEPSPPAANWIGTNHKISVINPDETYWFAITHDHYWRWLWKQLGFAHTNRVLRELVWEQVDKWIRIVDEKHHMKLEIAKDHWVLSDEEMPVEHARMKGADDFLREAAGVGRVREMEEVGIRREMDKQLRKGVGIDLRGEAESFEDGGRELRDLWVPMRRPIGRFRH